MDIISAYREVGSYRGAAAICETTPKTVRRVIERHEAGGVAPERSRGGATTTRSPSWLSTRSPRPRAGCRPSGCCRWRSRPGTRARGGTSAGWSPRRRPSGAGAITGGGVPAVWAPGEHLVIDWGVAGGAARVLRGPGLLAGAVRALRRRRTRGDHVGAARGVLRDPRRGPQGGAGRPDGLPSSADIVANRVVPTPDYVRFATHYRFRPDFCEGHDPESKGIVENLVGYAKRDLMIGCGLVERTAPAARIGVDLAAANAAAVPWCAEVNARIHSEIAAVPAERLAGHELDLLGGLPGLRPRIGGPAVFRKVDRLSCVRYGSARYSVPTTAIGTQVEVRVHRGELSVLTCVEATSRSRCWPATSSSPRARCRSSTRTTRRPARAVPARAVRAKTATEKAFLRAGTGRRGVPDRRGRGRVDPAGRRARRAAGPRPRPRPGRAAQALTRATAFGRWRAEDVRSILANAHAAPTPRPAGDALVVDLPAVPTRSLADYADLGRADAVERGDAS